MTVNTTAYASQLPDITPSIVPVTIDTTITGTVPDEVTVADLTDGNVQGNGVFDQLMRAVGRHLTLEYDANRITGADYTQAYIGSIAAVLQSSVQFVLSKDREVLSAELVKEQILKTRADTEATLQAATLTKQQQSTEALRGVVTAGQANKIAAEERLVKWKTTTEQAQTLSTVKNADDDTDIVLLNGSTAVGTMGKQQLLYQRQADGFLRDAEQKAAKLFADLAAVRYTTNPEANTDPYNYGFDTARSISVAAALANGV